MLKLKTEKVNPNKETGSVKPSVRKSIITWTWKQVFKWPSSWVVIRYSTKQPLLSRACPYFLLFFKIFIEVEWTREEAWVMYIYHTVTSIFCNIFKWPKFRLKSSGVSMGGCTKINLLVRFFSTIIWKMDTRDNERDPFCTDSIGTSHQFSQL